mgnify:CR=1 FL=1
MLITILDDFEGIFADVASLGLNYKGDKNVQVKVFNRRLLGDDLIPKRLQKLLFAEHSERKKLE